MPGPNATMAKSTAPPSSGISPLMKFLAILLGVLTPAVWLAERSLESFYIFQPAQLHDLAKRGLAAHGNDTRAVVRYIVDDLHSQDRTGAHINLDEEWIFNNAGGAMGAMYIIHASQSSRQELLCLGANCGYMVQPGS